MSLDAEGQYVLIAERNDDGSNWHVSVFLTPFDVVEVVEVVDTRELDHYRVLDDVIWTDLPAIVNARGIRFAD